MPRRAWVANVVFDVPGPTLDVYGENARSVASIYSDLLDLPLRTRADIYREVNYEADEGDELDPIVQNRDGIGFAFECERGTYHPPRWPDPDRPAQIHLDICVPDIGEAQRTVLAHGARLLLEAEDHRTYSDRIGHPFCLYPGAPGGTGRIERIVFDCFSPRTLAAFYREFLGMTRRVIDTPHLVEIAWEDSDGPAFAFQHLQHLPPRWPDPAYPQQVHIDYDFEDPDLGDLVLQLGGIRLPHMGGGFVYADPAGHPFCLGE